MSEILQLVVTLISGLIPMLTTIIKSREHSEEFEKYSSKMSILQMITEDRLNIMQGKLPLNYQAILDEFDNYTKRRGNSYVHQKVDEYIQLVKEITNNG